MPRRVGPGSVVAIVVAMLVLGALPAYAKDDHDDLVKALDGLTVTDEMVRGATFDLTAVSPGATFDIDAQGSTFPLETTATTDRSTVVTLTADLLFEFGKADLTDAARAALADLAKSVPQGAAVAVDGYTDSISGDDVNIPLSQQRAQTVKDALAAVRPDLMLTAAGHGSASPVAPNTNGDGSDNPVGRQLNRRVTLTYDRA